MRVVFPPLSLRTADTHVFAHMHTPMYMHSGTYKYVSAHTRARSQAMVSPFLLGPPIGSSGHGGNMGAPLGSLMCPSQVMSMSTVKTDCWGEGDLAGVCEEGQDVSFPSGVSISFSIS